MTLFDLCRFIKAQDVALRLGFPIVQRGSRTWVICPFHQEKSPSLLFYPDGKWRCFGCNEHGDAVAFYAKARNLTPYQAAKELLSLGYPEPSFKSGMHKNTNTSNAEALMRAVVGWVKNEHDKAYEIAKKFQKLISCELAWIQRNANRECIYEVPDLFYQCVAQRNQALRRMEELDVQEPHEMMQMMLEEAGNERFDAI